jgi:hypothetical protein
MPIRTIAEVPSRQEIARIAPAAVRAKFVRIAAGLLLGLLLRPGLSGLLRSLTASRCSQPRLEDRFTGALLAERRFPAVGILLRGSHSNNRHGCPFRLIGSVSFSLRCVSRRRKVASQSMTCQFARADDHFCYRKRRRRSSGRSRFGRSRCSPSLTAQARRLNRESTRHSLLPVCRLVGVPPSGGCVPAKAGTPTRATSALLVAAL